MQDVDLTFQISAPHKPLLNNRTGERKNVALVCRCLHNTCCINHFFKLCKVIPCISVFVVRSFTTAHVIYQTLVMHCRDLYSEARRKSKSTVRLLTWLHRVD